MAISFEREEMPKLPSRGRGRGVLKFAVRGALAIALIVLVAKVINSGDEPVTTPVVDERPVLGPADIASVVDADRTNAPRFQRDYKARRFSGLLPFRSVKTGLGNYHIEFGRQQIGGGVYCFTDKAVADRMIDWKAGQLIQVEGTVSDTNFGDLSLDHCRFN